MKRILSKNRFGYTFFEAMLLVTALGLLATLTAGRYVNFGSPTASNSRATQIAGINSALESFQMNGGTFGATYNSATSGINGGCGTLRNDTVAHLLTDLNAGVYCNGILYQIPTANVQWDGATPTDAYYAANLRLQ
jgi:hypothetical protein